MKTLFAGILIGLTLIATPSAAIDAKSFLDGKSFRLVDQTRVVTIGREHHDFFGFHEPRTFFVHFDFGKKLARVTGNLWGADKLLLTANGTGFCTQAHRHRKRCFTISKAGNNHYFVEKGRRVFFVAKAR